MHLLCTYVRLGGLVMDSFTLHGLPALQSEALASSAVRAAHKMQAALIVVFTVTGRTARLLAK
jgi:pyruvate kinase